MFFLVKIVIAYLETIQESGKFKTKDNKEKEKTRLSYKLIKIIKIIKQTKAD